jgi:hypothetical protein
MSQAKDSNIHRFPTNKPESDGGEPTQRNGISEIIFNMENTVHEAVYLSEAMRSLTSTRLIALSPGTVSFLANELEQRALAIQDFWWRAHEALHPDTPSRNPLY